MFDIFPIFSPNVLPIFSEFCKWQNWNCFHHRSTDVCKNTVKVKATFCSNEFLLRKMGKSAARHLRQPIQYLLWQCPWNISYSISFVCVRVCVCLLGWLSQLVPQQQCEWLKTTPRCVYKMVRRPCHIPLMAEVNAASNNKWTCEVSWRHEAESVQQHVVLQDPASTAAKNHSNLTFSVWTWVQYTWSKRHSFDYTLRISLRSTAFQRSLFILFAPSAILQSQGFWQHKGLEKHNTIFSGECHPDLQRIGNTKGLASCWR